MKKMWLQTSVAVLSGFIFALGLGVSGMTNPVKVFSFLDLFGRWDPTLIFVMIGAIVVHSIAFRLKVFLTKPILENEFKLPAKKAITPALIIGATLFGIGWGLAGYCPGPALVSIASLEFRPALFVLSMVVGMFLFQTLDHKFKFRK